jgi:hypothetical protein
MQDKILKLIITASAKGVKESVSQVTSEIKSGFTKGKEAVAAFNATVGNGHKAVSVFSTGLKTMLASVASFNALRKATSIVGEAEKATWGMADAISDANKEFDNIGSVASWENAISDLSKELRIYSGTELKNAASRTIELTKRMGLSESQMIEVMRRTSDLGNGNLDLEQTIEAVSHGLNGQNRAVQNLGLKLGDEYVQGQYKANAANVKTWDSLSDLEKIQQRYLVFLKQTDAVLGSTADSTNTFAGAMKEVKAQISDSIANNKSLLEALNAVAAALKNNSGEIAGIISWIITAVAKTIELAVEWKGLLIALAGTAVAALGVAKLYKYITGLSVAIKVLTGSGLSTWLTKGNVAMQTLAGQSALAANAMKVGLAAAAVYGAVKIVELIYVIYKWRQAVKAQAEAEKNLAENTNRVMNKFADYKDFKLPDDITDAAQADLEEFRRSLSKARAYYTALRSALEEKAEETTIFGNATEEAKEAQEELKTVNARLEDIQEDFKRVGGSAADAAEDMQKPTEAVKATEDQLNEFEKAAKAAYEDAKKAAADYAQQVIEWEDKIKYAKMSTEDKIRELSRKTMTEEQSWNDQKLQADQKYYEAKQALARGDYELAEKLAQQAQDMYANLATEVTKTENGNDVVVKSLEDTTDVAKDGVQAVGSLIEQLYSAQRDAAQAAKNEWTATAEGILAQLDEIAKQREANIQITLSGLEAAASAINSLTRDETKYIYVKTVYSSSGSSSGSSDSSDTSESGYASGGKLAGFGGGDRIRALLEAGEFVVRKEAVKKYGAGLFAALNAMRFNLNDAVKARVGGLISNISMPEIPRFAAGGMAGLAGGGEVMTLNFQAGGVEMPLKVIGSRRVTRGMVKEFERELVKMGLSKR